MQEHLYNILGEICIIIMIALIAHYVFLEPKWRKWQYYFNFAGLFILILAEILIKSEERVLICLLVAGMNICLARKKHRFRGFFLVIPIMGISMGILMPIMCLPDVLFQVPEVIGTIIVDSLTVILLLFFSWKGKKWREKFELEMQYRKLQRWESRLLICVGVLLFWLVEPLVDNVFLGNLEPGMKAYIVLSNVSALVLTITVIVLVMQGNKSAYYENIAALNEKYLHAEIQHFQAYRQTQTETRRVRHDMKNHMQSMLYLAKEEKFEDLKKYLETINLSVEQLDAELQCGNSLADAICNEKNQLALHKGISFEIEGRMPESVKIEQVDICTIFANALDNAIEAQDNENMKKKWIKLEISCQGEIVFFRFTNPMDSTKLRCKHMGTSKKDKINHGFGLQNIRFSVEKYNGEMSTTIYEDDADSIFSLEIMLMNS